MLLMVALVDVAFRRYCDSSEQISWYRKITKASKIISETL